MLTGSLYVADSLESGVAITGDSNTGFVRSLGYEGYAAGFAGFLLWSGSALNGSLGTRGGVPYSGVGLELYANTSSYFRYSTTDNDIDVRTDSFFFGSDDPGSTNFISGSNGNIEISSSAFHLNPNGSVTASGLLVVNGPNVLFDSNNEFADAVNIGRILYYSPAEISTTYSAITSAGGTVFGEYYGITSSMFETFLLPGETRIQFSCMIEVDNSAYGVGINSRAILIKHYISTGSIYAGSTAASNYDLYNSEQSVGSHITLAGNTTGGNFTSGGRTFDLTSDEIADRQGMYCRIRSVIYTNLATVTLSSTIKLKSFVYRASRSIGGSTTSPATPIRE